MTETQALAVSVVLARYREGRMVRPVDGAEVFWDSAYRLTVALYNDADGLLAVYQILADRGIVRIPRRLPRITHPVTLNGPGTQAWITAAAAAGVPKPTQDETEGVHQ